MVSFINKKKDVGIISIVAVVLWKASGKPRKVLRNVIKHEWNEKAADTFNVPVSAVGGRRSCRDNNTLISQQVY